MGIFHRIKVLLSVVVKLKMSNLVNADESWPEFVAVFKFDCNWQIEQMLQIVRSAGKVGA